MSVSEQTFFSSVCVCVCVCVQAALVLRLGLQPAEGSGPAGQVESGPGQHRHLSHTLPPTG